MHILCVGLNHRTAPVSLRERLCFDPERRKATLARYGCDKGASGGPLQELVVLSTCNRVELYAASRQAAFDPLVELLAETGEVLPAELEGHLYCSRGPSAVENLFRVASGLESQVLGEHEILGQVADAYAVARRIGAAGAVLSRLLKATLHTGRRVRSETAISHHPASISSLAVQRSAQIVGSLEAAKVVVIGAGEMAELAVAALVKRGVRRLTAVNRTLARAELVAERWGARAKPFESLRAELRDADIAITSTAAPHTVLRRDAVAACMADRPGRPLVLVDIAVPRDVEPAVAEIPGVYLYDIDDLSQELADSLATRRREIPAAERVIAEELRSFQAWLDTLPVTPLIRDMRCRAEEIRCRELEKTLRRMPDIREEDRDRIEQLSRGLVQKLLHAPTLSLKRESQNGNAALFATVARQLFDLETAQSVHQTPPRTRVAWPAPTDGP